MRVALITEFLPYPLDNAPKIRLYEELKILSQKNEIDLFCFLPPEASSDWISKIESLGVNVFAVRMQGGWRKKVCRMTQALFSEDPYYFLKWNDFRLNNVISKRIELVPYDLFHVDHTQMAGYLPKEKRSRAILVAHNVEHVLLERYANIAPKAYRPFVWKEAEKVKRSERLILRDFSKIVCMTEHDRNLILSLTNKNPNDVVSIPTCVNTEYFKPRGLEKYENPALVFTGDFTWAPTRQGLLWFLKEIFPKVVDNLRDSKVYIVGQFRHSDAKRFSSKSVIFTGRVDDVREHLEKCWLFVNPMRASAGIRTRLLHALSMGLCAVSTTIGFEGLDDSLKDFVWCEDSAKDFAQKCIELLSDKSLLAKQGLLARESVIKLYGLNQFEKLWLNLYSEIEEVITAV